jgi:hypothetical protein
VEAVGEVQPVEGELALGRRTLGDLEVVPRVVDEEVLLRREDS